MGLSEDTLSEVCPYVKLALLGKQEVILCKKKFGKSLDSDIKLESGLDIIKIGEKGVCRATMFCHNKKELNVEINIDELYDCPYRRD